MGARLGDGMLAAAEADFQPDFCYGRGEGCGGVFRCCQRESEAREGQVQQAFLAGAELVAARPAIQAVGRRFDVEGQRQRPKAAFRVGTKSVRSQVNVPNFSSGVRPKWP